MKRAFDVVVSVVGMVLVFPILLVVTCGILLSMGRPILFRQARVGRGGREFSLLKFRTMTVLQGSESGSFDAGDRRRVTPLGRILRSTKADELPQLWNVLRGDMSLVGPRPEVRMWVNAYPDRWARVLTVRPGITDPASIRYRHEEILLAGSDDPEQTYRQDILPKKLALYEEYVSTRSFAGDLYLIFATAVAIFPTPALRAPLRALSANDSSRRQVKQ